MNFIYKKNSRFNYGFLFILLLSIEFIIALYIHDNFIRPYIGDVLAVAVLYCFTRMFFPKGIRLLPLYVFLFALLTELLQYFQIVKLLRLESNSFARILFGSTFDWADIACYGIGCLTVFALEESRMNRKNE